MKDDFQLFKHHKNYSIYKSERGWLNYYSDGAIESLQMVHGEFDTKTNKLSPSKITVQDRTGEIYQWETLYINGYNMGQFGIAVTADGKMILFVCEGRQMTEGVAGLTTADVANVLLDLGCVEAINLDGGGSSCMLVNGKTTIKVSDGSQRAVGSTVMIK